jgi:hypothetical protein
MPMPLARCVSRIREFAQACALWPGAAVHSDIGIDDGVAWLVDEEAIAPEDVATGRLSNEVRQTREHRLFCSITPQFCPSL